MISGLALAVGPNSYLLLATVSLLFPLIGYRHVLSKLHCLVIVMQGHYLFWVWIALMRTLLIKVLIHENVTEFGDAEIRLHLADLYVILRLELSPVQFGWPSQRNRQLVVCILKVWIFGVLPDHSSSSEVIMHLDIERTLQAMFFRKVGIHFTWASYLVAEPFEIALEFEWARTRPGVRERWAQSLFNWNDPGTSYLASLTIPERRRYDTYMQRWPQSCCNVGQDPDVMAQRSCGDGTLQTLTKAGGIIMLPRSMAPDNNPRWMCPAELFTSLGFPVKVEAQAAAGNVSCCFSQGHPAPTQRSENSMRAQAGNSIHVNVMGAVVAVLVLKLPMLGEKEPSHHGGSRASKSSSVALFRALARSRGVKRPRDEDDS